MLRQGEINNGQYIKQDKAYWREYYKKKNERPKMPSFNIDLLVTDEETRSILMDYYLDYICNHIEMCIEETGEEYAEYEISVLRLCLATGKILTGEWHKYKDVLTNSFQTVCLLERLKPYIEENANITYKVVNNTGLMGEKLVVSVVDE